ncbi:MAG TPA: DUF692 domain-containing protein [Candidatus Binataceae bacterium]|jgi:uncharacterized protein (UPF0276 family)|nr:DUF692 domain-containing protein [Candidatus Binataceae bacterium]
MDNFPFIGHGVGLRPPHYGRLLEDSARADWFEVISENFMIRGGRPLLVLEKAREQAPIVLHGVSLNLGGVDPLRSSYLDELAALIERFEPAWVSDHLCWGSIGGHYAHDLLPLPYTEEALKLTASRVRQVQERLGRQILIENVSSYLTYRHSAMPEWEFLDGVAQQADCGILLDVNNIYVSAQNHGFSAAEYISRIAPQRVGQIHLAGHSDAGTHLVDTHDHPVPEPVWDLLRMALERCGRVSTLIEWDAQIPEFEELTAHAERARAIQAQVMKAHTRAA